MPRQVIAAAALSVAVSLMSTAAAAVTFAGIDVPPPLPPKVVVETLWNTPVEDPYRFLENVRDAQVESWMKSEADATAAILARIPGRAALLARIREIEATGSGLADQLTRTRNGRYFYLKREPGDNQFKLVYRDGQNGVDTVIVDPEALARTTGHPHAIMDFAPSPDGKRIAYAIQAGGGEIGELHVVDLATGRELIPPIDRIRYSGAAWLDDGSGFFYSRLPAGFDQRPQATRFDDRQRRFRALDAAGTDRLVFDARTDPAMALPRYAAGYVFQVPGTRLAVNLIFLGVERYRLVYIANIDEARNGTAKWRKVAGADDRIADIAAGGGWLYLRTSAGAPRFKIVRVPLAAPDLARAETVLAQGEGVITSIGGARDALYIARRDGVTLSLLRAPHARTATVENVPLPFAGTVTIASADPLIDGVLLELGGWTRVLKPFAYDPARRTLTQLPLVTPGAFDAPDNIAAREVRVKSHDGVEVPLSIVARKDIRLDGSNPTILYGYGAYGTTEDPFLNMRILAWIERGGAFAVAHVRGGGAFGEDWHMAGRKATKPNTWKDAIAAGEWLIANGYTSKQKLGIYGGSAGGILVGRAITERPDLFAAAVPAVGDLDSLRMESSANGAANIPEFGTVAKEDEFRALLAMSSYQHIKDGTPYPGTLLVHGVNDIRVDVWNSTKFASRLATATTSGKPVLLRLEYEAGHGQGSTRAQLQERAADMWSFMLWQFGDPEFQPKAPAT